MVPVEFRDAIVVGQEDIRITRAVQIRRRHGKRPPPASNAQPPGNVLEPPVSQIAKEILPTAVLRVFETLGHHPGGFEVPQVKPIRPVSGNKQIQTPVAIVIQPDGASRVKPAGQPGVLAHTREPLSGLVPKQLRPAPFVHEKVFEAVVVIVPPDSAHRNSGSRGIQFGHPHPAGHVFELPVPEIPIKPVRRAFRAVGHVKVLPTVPVEIRDRHRGAHCGDVRHDMGQLRVERGPAVHEVNAALSGDFLERKSELGHILFIPRPQTGFHEDGHRQQQHKDRDRDAVDRSA